MEWDEIGVLGFLESEPEIVESECSGWSYKYKTSKHGLNLHLSISPLEGDLSIHMNMVNVEKPFLEYVLLDCERIKIAQDSQGIELLEIKGPKGLYIHISIQPSINVAVGGNAL